MNTSGTTLELSDRELRGRLKTEPEAAKIHELIANWEPLKSVA